MSYIRAKKTPEMFAKEAAEKNTKLDVIGVYTGSMDKIHCRCKKCGRDSYPKANAVLRNVGCICARSSRPSNRVLNAEKYRKKLLTYKNGQFTALEDYIPDTTAASKILHRCNKCGHEWRVAGQQLGECPGQCKTEKLRAAGRISGHKAGKAGGAALAAKPLEPWMNIIQFWTDEGS